MRSLKTSAPPPPDLAALTDVLADWLIYLLLFVVVAFVLFFVGGRDLSVTVLIQYFIPSVAVSPENVERKRTVKAC